MYNTSKSLNISSSLTDIDTSKRDIEKQLKQMNAYQNDVSKRSKFSNLIWNIIKYYERHIAKMIYQ